MQQGDSKRADPDGVCVVNGICISGLMSRIRRDLEMTVLPRYSQSVATGETESKSRYLEYKDGENHNKNKTLRAPRVKLI